MQNERKRDWDNSGKYILNCLKTHLPHIKQVHQVQPSGNAPANANHSRGTDRLAVPLIGNHQMEIACQEDKPSVMDCLPGTCIWIPSGTWNAPTWAVPVTTITIIIHQRRVRLHLVEHKEHTTPISRLVLHDLGQTMDKCGHLTLEALRSLPIQHPAAPYLVAGFIRVIRQYLQEGTQTHQESRSARLCMAILAYLAENAGANLSRDDVAARFGITPNHLSRLFTLQTGTSFNQYLIRLRMERARQLLSEQPTLMVKEVAYGCGYQDVNYFCRQFKTFYGCTPNTLRSS